jgi:hypothetical protein
MTDSYRIVRFYRDDRDTTTITAGLTLADAQAHCNRADTRGEDWFDAYTREDTP